jgi:hypothetical protein
VQQQQEIRVPGPVPASPTPQRWELELVRWRDPSGTPQWKSPHERATWEEALIKKLLQAHTTTTVPS